MNLYTYDMDTFEYTGVVTAQKRPNGDDITEMLGATTVHPPEIADGYAAVWSGGAWSLLEDHRQKYDERGVKTGGTPYWLKGDTYQTAARYMTELGPLPDGALLVQPAEPEPTLDEAQQSQLETINSAYESTVAVAKVNTPDGEVLTWDIQKIEAEDWAADNSAETPFIDGIATGRGMDRVVLIEKVLAKAEAYRDLVSVQTGIRQGLEDAIFAAETVDAVRAIVWPVDDADDGADVDGAADASAD